MSDVPGGPCKDRMVSTAQEQLAAVVLGAASCACSREVAPQADVLLVPVCVTATAKGGTEVSRGPIARQAGVTLMELLVVIAIIGILAAILVPAVTAAHRRGRLVQCASNLKQIGAALSMYADCDRGYFPVWRDRRRAEFPDRDGTTYGLDATFVVQLPSGDSYLGVPEKIGLGCLYPGFLADERVLDDPGCLKHMPLGALVTSTSRSGPDGGRVGGQDILVEAGYFFVNADFEGQGIRGPAGFHWRGFHSKEPIAWCAQDPENGRVAHNLREINVLYLDGHVTMLEPREDAPDYYYRPLWHHGRRPQPLWTAHSLLRAVKELSGTYDQEYPPR